MTIPASPRLTNRSFVFFVITQYLGAFNDNVFKQILLVLAITMTEVDTQGVVTILFALPFVMFSSYSGQTSEKFSKTDIMRLAKILELVIMILAVVGFYLKSLPLLFGILFIMGAQSTLFGPAKYGIIPEMITPERLVSANGIVQMTTFGAIILGQAAAGWFGQYENNLEYAGYFAVVIAVLGIASVFAIAPRPANKPDMRFRRNPLARLMISNKEIVADPPLLLALIANCFFWYSGGMVVQIINSYGIILLDLGTLGTSILLVCLAIGTMAGSLTCGPLQRMIGSQWTIIAGAIGVALSEFALFFHWMPLDLLRFFLFCAGFFTGLYVVPLAAFLQKRPPMGRKGEILAAMNFWNSVAILCSGFTWLFLVQVLPAPYAWCMLSFCLLVLLAIMYPKLKDIN